MAVFLYICIQKKRLVKEEAISCEQPGLKYNTGPRILLMEILT